MGYFSIGSKTAMGLAAGAGVGYAGYKATGAGYTNTGMATMGVGTALGVGSFALGKRSMGLHANARAMQRVAKQAGKVANKEMRRGNLLKGAGKISALAGLSGGAYGLYNQKAQGDIGGAAMGYGVAAVGLGLGLKSGLAGRRLVNSGVNLTEAIGAVESGLMRGGKLPKGYARRAASTGKAVSRTTARSAGRSVTALPSPSVGNTGMAVNPAAARAVTRPAIGPETRGQRAGNAIFKAIGSTMGGGFFS